MGKRKGAQISSLFCNTKQLSPSVANKKGNRVVSFYNASAILTTELNTREFLKHLYLSKDDHAVPFKKRNYLFVMRTPMNCPKYPDFSCTYSFDIAKSPFVIVLASLPRKDPPPPSSLSPFVKFSVIPSPYRDSPRHGSILEAIVWRLERPRGCHWQVVVPASDQVLAARTVLP